MRYNKKVNRLLTLAQRISLKKIIIKNSQFTFKLRILLADMRAWQTCNELLNKSKLKNFLINIHTQLNRLIEIQYDILNMMCQRINFSFVFMKQLDSMWGCVRTCDRCRYTSARDALRGLLCRTALLRSIKS